MKSIFIQLESLVLGYRKDTHYFKHNLYTNEGYVGVPVLFARENFSPSEEQERKIMTLLKERRLYCLQEDYSRFYHKMGGENGRE